ncbi:hypothetical protein [Burkholderia guangdongensis]|uniref:hypothetical protein n=1 Tax=Burkholderia guangdongensis TaxID=1792500 RepID=UPI0015CA06C2|nr:hypothetical protein [Burkholderia guangdongensis]
MVQRVQRVHSAGQRSYLKLASATVAVLAAFGLAGCGGDDDGGASASPGVSLDEAKPGGGGTPAAGGASIEEAKPGGGGGGAPGSSATIKVEGESLSLFGDVATARVMVPPVAWRADGSLPTNTTLRNARDVPAAGLKELAPGAYVELPTSDDSVLSLSTGTITDIAGNGQYAIGRWTAGSDSAGHTYAANQGQVWAVGVPIQVTMALDEKLTCSLVASTRPTATDGNTAPGSLDDASATVRFEKDVFDQFVPKADISLRYSIGSDKGQSFEGATWLGAIQTSTATRSSLMTRLVGSDPSKPYLVVSYGVSAPSTGGINGIAVLSCK